MAQIDVYLSMLRRVGATEVILASGRNVTVRFPKGERFASKTTPHQTLVEVVEEVAPPSSQRAVRTGQDTTFEHGFDGVVYRILVEPWANAWRVTIAPMPQSEGTDEPHPPWAPHREEGASAQNDLPTPPAAPASATVWAPAAAPPPPAASARPSAPVQSPSPAVAPHRDIQADAQARPPRVELAPNGEGLVADLLRQMVQLGASDLHLSSGLPPYLRVGGAMRAVQDLRVLSAAELLHELYRITPESNRGEFEERHDTDFGYSIPGVARYRANIFRDRRGPGAVFRMIPEQILTPEQIRLPKSALDLCHLNKGLVLVTGPTGSGKTTTLATMIDYLNQNRTEHIITVEDPIEFVHENKRCLVTQREVYSHTRSFADALRAALREDPDIVLVGEMRDLETVAMAIETAETGHLVFGTLHTTSAPSTIDRIIDQFPADRQEQIRQMLSESLRGVVAQNLCRRKGGGRVAAYEVLVCSSAVSNLIRERKTFQLFSLMQTGRGRGMVTLADSLLELVRNGEVEPHEAFLRAANKAEFLNLLKREGIDFEQVQA